MSRLGDLPRRKVIGVLTRNGLVYQRRAPHGDIYIHPEDGTRRTTVPRGSPIRKSTVDDIRKEAQRRAHRHLGSPSLLRSQKEFARRP